MQYTFDVEIFSDLHKDAFGFRPREHEFWTASDDKKQEIWDYTLRCLDESLREEEEGYRRALERFEADLVCYQMMGAGSREDATRWKLQSEGLDKEYDPDYICYCLGLAYKHKDLFIPHVKKRA